MTDTERGIQRLQPSLYQVFRGPAEPAPAQIAAAHLGGRLSALSAAARRVRHEQDPEAVHDLRVASRRLTAAIDLWEPLLGAKGARRARRRARRMRRDVAKLRDLEVLGTILREHALTGAPEARAVLESVLIDVTRDLAAEREAAPRAASRRRVRRVGRALERALRSPSAGSPGSADSPGSESRTPGELADAHVSAMRDRAIQALDAGWASGEDHDLHGARIRVKRWRYAIECRAGLSSATAAEEAPHTRGERELLKRLRLLQESLGGIQDLSLVREHLEAAARRALLHAQPEAAALQSTLARLAPARALAAAEAQRLSTTLSEGRAGA